MGKLNRQPQVPREVRDLLDRISKADLAELLVDRIALDHPRGADDASGEWLAAELREHWLDLKARRGG